MTRKPRGPLRRGWTTGACATAAAKAACTALLGGGFPDPVEIELPKGGRTAFALARHDLAADRSQASAAVVKDAGDDPDVTHGATIVATLRPGAAGAGVTFRAGEGVGTITRPGLPLPPGEPAINPVPRRMMAAAVAEVAAALGGSGDVEITVSVPGGEEMARHTWNPRLGILGGLSILGTTGVVVPFSCSAWIHSIHRGVDVARAAGLEHVAACTGSTSEALVAARYGLPEHAFIDMGDFAGGTLKYLRRHPLPRLTLAGGFAKLAKLGQGALDLHSGRSQVDLDWLAGRLAGLGAGSDLLDAARGANTGNQVLTMAAAAGLPLGDDVAAAALATARAVLEDAPVTVEVLVVDRAGFVAGAAGGW
jgi:cobalt-precorrin-5B (C1)-methyltransferase